MRRLSPVQSFTAALICALAVISFCPQSGVAGAIEITGESQAAVASGRPVTFEFGIWNYGANNPGVSAIPTALSFQTYFELPGGSEELRIPGSAANTIDGITFAAYLESMDGSLRIPLADGNASRLGLSPGVLAPVAGSVCGAWGCTGTVAVLRGSVTMTPAMAEALFGGNVWSDRAAARISLVNHGPPITLGLGGPYTIGQSFQIPGVSGDGLVTTAGLPGKVVVYNPEPGTVILLAAPLVWMIYRARRRRG